MPQSPPSPGWYADPVGGGGTRWWDGNGWTARVRPAPEPPAGPPVSRSPAPEPPPAPGPSLYDQPVLLVGHRAGVAGGYAIHDGQGRRVGAVVEVGQGTLQRAARSVPGLDRFRALRLEVRDGTGAVLVLTRPAGLRRARTVVARPGGPVLGEIAPAGVLGRAHAELLAGGRVVGVLRAADRRSRDLVVVDPAGTEVARITRAEEEPARPLPTTLGRTVVLLRYRLPEPLASMVLAAALTVPPPEGHGLN